MIDTVATRPAVAVAVVYVATLLLHAGVGELVQRHRPTGHRLVDRRERLVVPVRPHHPGQVAYGVLLVLLLPGRLRGTQGLLVGTYVGVNRLTADRRGLTERADGQSPSCSVPAAQEAGAR